MDWQSTFPRVPAQRERIAGTAGDNRPGRPALWGLADSTETPPRLNIMDTPAWTVLASLPGCSWRKSQPELLPNFQLADSLIE
jgi:hypothetical protein